MQREQGATWARKAPRASGSRRGRRRFRRDWSVSLRPAGFVTIGQFRHGRSVESRPAGFVTAARFCKHTAPASALAHAPAPAPSSYPHPHLHQHLSHAHTHTRTRSSSCSPATQPSTRHPATTTLIERHVTCRSPHVDPRERVPGRPSAVFAATARLLCLASERAVPASGCS